MPGQEGVTMMDDTSVHLMGLMKTLHLSRVRYTQRDSGDGYSTQSLITGHSLN